MARGHPTIFVAASIPRSMRTTRLSHLPLNVVIGSWAIENDEDMNVVYDVIMLPESEFRRSQIRLGDAHLANPSLSRGNMNTAYSPRDMRKVTVPEGEADPARWAARYFAPLFSLDIHRTIYGDDVTVAASLATSAIKETSWTRTISAPKNAASAVVDAVPASRSPTDKSKT